MAAFGRRASRVWFAVAAAWALLSAAAAPAPASAEDNGIVVCIDPGHQRHANTELEPDGPGSSERKPKVSAGTTGVATGKPEYALNLEVSLLLRDKLRESGYRVVMTREEHDVDISNKERADIANEAHADLFLRIHADGSASGAVHGISVLYPSKKNPYTAPIQADSEEAAANVLDAMVAATGAASRGTTARDDLSGFNWAKVPTVLVEMGFMSNPAEDRLMSEPDYQRKLADGMAAGVEAYFKDRMPALGTVVVDERITLTEEAALYEQDGRRFVRTPYAIAAQSVQAFERAGSWYRIHTWLGDRWVDGAHALAGEAAFGSFKLELTERTQLYRYPEPGIAPLGALAPQTVEAFASWNGWWRIHTWLGDAWVRG